MDVDIALERIKTIMGQLNKTLDINGNVNAMKPDLANLIDAWDGLNYWMSSGGFLPKDWDNAR